MNQCFFFFFKVTALESVWHSSDMPIDASLLKLRQEESVVPFCVHQQYKKNEKTIVLYTYTQKKKKKTCQSLFGPMTPENSIQR